LASSVRGPAAVPEHMPFGNPKGGDGPLFLADEKGKAWRDAAGPGGAADAAPRAGEDGVSTG